MPDYLQELTFFRLIQTNDGSGTTSASYSIAPVQYKFAFGGVDAVVTFVAVLDQYWTNFVLEKSELRGRGFGGVRRERGECEEREGERETAGRRDGGTARGRDTEKGRGGGPGGRD